MDVKSEPVATPWFRSVLATFIATLGGFGSGSMYSYSTMAVQSLTTNTTRNFEIDNIGLLTMLLSGLPLIGAVPAGFICMFIKDVIGRKKTVVLGCAISTVSWLLIASAQNVWMMYVGATLNGFGVILFLPAACVYIAEISPDNLRAYLVSTIELSINMGTLLTYIVGIYLRWDYLAVFIMCFPVVCGTLMLFVPETPRFLVFKGKNDAALAALRWFFGDIDQERTQQVLAAIDNSLDDIRQPTPWLNLLRKPLLKHVLLIQLLYTLQVGCGYYTVRFNLSQILASFNSNLNDNLQIIIYACMAFVGSVVCSAIVGRFKRRTFLLLSTAVMIISTAALGVYYLLLISLSAETVRSLSWLPLTALVVSTVGYSLGLGPVPYMVASELFETKSRARAVTAGLITFFVVLIINVFVSQGLQSSSQNAIVFFISSAFCVLGFGIIYFFLPETKDRQLDGKIET